MKILISKSNDPFYNLSLEEIILKNYKNSNVLLIYINHNTIVIGRNQNTNEEINHQYVKDNNIKVIRRVSGGGSVYHDSGNINFSFITKKSSNSYAKFLTPIIGLLNSLGLDAKFKGKNDVEVNGYKISGNAQYFYKDRMFHHGTLLFNTNMSVLGQALKPNLLKLESKSIKSNRARVSNIKDLLKQPLTTNEFINKLKEYFLIDKNTEEVNEEYFNTSGLDELISIRKSNDWNYNKNPNFNFSNDKRFPEGTISLNMLIQDNKIKEIKIWGDFLSKNDFETIYELFIGIDFNINKITKIINSIENFENFFGNLLKEDLLQLFKGTNK